MAQQPWLHDLVVCVSGNVTAVGSAAGDIVPLGAQGVFIDDRRVVCLLDVEVAGEPPAAVASAALGRRAEFLGSARNLGATTADPVVEVHRRRELTAGGLDEQVTVVSRADRGVGAALRIRVAGDGAPIAAVKSGVAPGDRITPAISAAGAVLRDEWHETRVTFDPPSARLEDVDGIIEAWFDLDLNPGESRQVTVRVRTRRLRRTALDTDAGGELVGWARVRVTGADPRLAPTVHAALTDLHALLLTDPEAPQDVFAGAGTPWYLTLFGRDSIWAAQLTLPLGTDLARGTLRALGRRQGRRHDTGSGESPGKIPHEVRRVPYLDPVSGMRLPSVYYGTVDATALWVVLLHDAWRWGLDERDVRELFDVLDAAVGWLTTDAVPDQDGLLKYHDEGGDGLSNQGWKDSSDAIRYRDGQIAASPIALVEAQAYGVHALECAARLADAFGRAGADDLRRRAEELRRQVRHRYWVHPEAAPSTGRAPGRLAHTEPAERPYLGLAVAGSGHLVDGLGSNMGHVLGTTTLRPEEAVAVADTLTGPELLDRFGVRTLGTGNGGYNPIGYHTGSIWTHDTAIAALGLATEGLRAEAVRVAATLLTSAEAFGYRWPELYAGEPMMGRPAPYPAACRPQAWSAASAVALITIALGFRPDAPDNTLHLHPVRPAAYGPMRVEGVRLGPSEVDLDVASDGEVTVTRATGGVRVVVHGTDPEVSGGS